jgi:hypothetical protein
LWEKKDVCDILSNDVVAILFHVNLFVFANFCEDYNGKAKENFLKENPPVRCIFR